MFFCNVWWGYVLLRISEMRITWNNVEPLKTISYFYFLWKCRLFFFKVTWVFLRSIRPTEVSVILWWPFILISAHCTFTYLLIQYITHNPVEQIQGHFYLRSGFLVIMNYCPKVRFIRLCRLTEYGPTGYRKRAYRLQAYRLQNTGLQTTEYGPTGYRIRAYKLQNTGLQTTEYGATDYRIRAYKLQNTGLQTTEYAPTDYRIRAYRLQNTG